MNAEFFEALDLLEKEKGILKAHMLDKVRAALEVAIKRDYNNLSDNISIKIDSVKKEITAYILKTVVEQVEDQNIEISLEDAKAISKKLELGDVAEIKVDIKNFGRISAQHAKQVIIQGIREAERGMILQEFTSKEHEIISAVVNRVDPRTRNITLGIGKTEAILVAGEQIPGEDIREGDHIKVYVVEVKKTAKGPQVMISRTHKGIVERLFEIEVPEIAKGVVEIKAVAREAGSRTKIAVSSNDPNVDPVGSCIGPRKSRKEAVQNELNGEKIDIIKYSDIPEKFISEALSPAEVIRVTMKDDAENSCIAYVPDHQLSLAIGKEGQNARLSARLTGWKIDIQPESKMP